MKFDIKKMKVGCGHLWYHLHENWCSESLQDMEDCPDCPEFNIKEANLLEKYDFMAFVMKYVRCKTKWGDLTKWEEREGRTATTQEQVKRGAPVLCYQLSQIMALVAEELGMKYRFVNFGSAEKSHWGIDIELEKNNWAFYDPTYSFCVKDPLPLDSKQIQDRPGLLDVWHNNFSQTSSLCVNVSYTKTRTNQMMSLPDRFKLPLNYIDAQQKLEEYGDSETTQ